MRTRALITTLAALLCFGCVLDSSATPQNDPPQSQNQYQNKPPDTGSQAPTSAPSSPAENPAPPSQAPAAPPGEPPTPEQAPAPSTVEVKPSGTATTKKKLTRRRRKRTSGKAPAAQSGKVVVRNGGTSSGTAQLSPGVTQEQVLHQRENTDQLLATTDANLKRVAGRQLTPAQQSIADQIHTYMRQAKAATEAGDIGRAHTLAYKARLLSDDLARK
jgi:hypothetical protein